MLNKNQSKKWNSWKYALVIPALVAFVFLFQMEVIAKEKNVNPKIEQAASEDVDVYKITKNTTEAELKEKAETILKNYGVSVLFSDTKRNTNNEITEITVEFKKGKEIAKNRTVKSTDSIKPFAIVITKNSKGNLSIDFVEEHEKYSALVQSTNIVAPNEPIPADTQIYIDGTKSDKTKMDELDPNEIASVNVTKNDEKKEIRIITKKFSKIGEEGEIYINGKKVTQNELDQLDQGAIERMDVTNNFGKKEIRITTKNGTHYQDKNMPVPPVPPTAPIMKFKAPTAPAFPKAPKAPKGDPVNGDKKAWKDFDKKMEEFDKQMKKLEPQMEAFDKQMAEFDKQMEPFNKEMEVFNEKMKIFDKQMEEYTAKIDKEKK